MSMIIRSLLPACAVAAVATFALPSAAAAQLLFDWGGQEKVNDTGRLSVRINADAKPGEIIVSFSDRKLYLITGPGQAMSYPVAIPREQDRWEGRTTVTQKRENPSWTPTPSMLKENPRLPRWVPGGHPMNPLGNRAMYLGSSYYRIHGTDAPWTIGTAVSKGCIRMYNKDALEVYERIKVGAKVLVTWKNYQAIPDGQQPPVSASNETPASSRAAERAVPAAADPAPRPQRQQSRYSDIFGTSEPPAAASAPPPNATAERAPPAPPSRAARSRENAPTPSRERRPGREAGVEQPRSEPAAASAAPARQQESSRYSDIFGTPEPSALAPAREAAAEPAQTPSARPVRTRDSQAREQRQRTTPVETGSIPERRPRAKAAAPPAEPAPAPQQALVAPQPEAATKALEAAERAAAAAERAAAAAERAERAAAARAAASTPSAASPAAAPSAD